MNIYINGLRDRSPGETVDEVFLEFVNQIKMLPLGESRNNVLLMLVEAYFEVSKDDYH